VARFQIDRSLHRLKHWIDEGVKNAAAAFSPDPFFTAPHQAARRSAIFRLS